MNNTEKVSQALATTEQVSMQELVERSAKELKRVLPKHMSSERLVRIALTCVRQAPELAQCPASFIGALLVCAQLGLEPLAGRAYILPFWNSKSSQKEAQFLIGYKGLAELFYRHERSVQLMWGTVRSGDEFEYEYGTNAFLRHRPAMKSDGETLGYYVIAELRGGAKPFLYMSREECMKHGEQHSKTYDTKRGQFHTFSPWATDPDAMAKKTVLIQLSKLLPLSIELQRAIGADETSREYRSGIDNVLDIPSTTDWNEEKETKEPETKKPKAPEATYEVKPDKSPGVYDIWKNGELTYHVDTHEEYCSCPAGTLQPKNPCKHLQMVADYQKSQEMAQKQGKKAQLEPGKGKDRGSTKTGQKQSKTEGNGISESQANLFSAQIARKVIGVPLSEAKDMFPENLTTSQFTKIFNWLVSQKKGMEPSDFIRKMAEITKK